ncbi:aldehyde dehydrogenase family protein, partial [Actinocorallia lasiicapitis]
TALEQIADALDAHADELWALADQETALGETRLRGEIARSSAQFRLFAEVLIDGGYADAVIDHADGARPDLRRMNRPLPGVVGVFAASNFPFAFSVAGGDVASALAAGCSAVVKAHPGHPRLSALTARVIGAALPDPALLRLVQDVEAGRLLVQHPEVVAVGFTGSLRGGEAVQRLIGERDTPIPFFGELGSVNPVVVLPSASPVGLAEGFAASLTLGAGQFCTNPGLLFVPAQGRWVEEIAAAVARSSGGPMLTERIKDGYVDGLQAKDGLPVLAEGAPGPGPWAAIPTVFTTDLATFTGRLPGIAEETFGPSAVVVTYPDPAELPPVLALLPGSLTATIHAGEPAEAGAVAEVFARTAGRLIWNGWPTGVAVTWAQHHGGPWPATTAPASTSVGTAAIGRWLTPVAYQSWPQELLPPELRDGNPLGVVVRVDGILGEFSAVRSG